MSKTPKSWNEVKAKIVLEFGSMKRCAQKADCTDQALRMAFRGSCPLVAQRLERLLGISLGTKAHARRNRNSPRKPVTA